MIQNAVISERVKKCGRIKAPFASGGPENWPARTFSVATVEREGRERERKKERERKDREENEAAQGPTVIGSAYL